MFEDVCLVCSKPVDASRAYCSDLCARQDAASPDSSTASSTSSHPSPFIPHTQLNPLSDIPPLVLHHPHPHYLLPLASPLQQPNKQRQHMRKRSSLSSSSASSALSTPSMSGSAPPGLTDDDDDSMSDPEFMLDQHLRGRTQLRELDSESCRTAASSTLPSLTYARRPSTTNTRSTIPAALLTPDSAQSHSLSLQEQQEVQSLAGHRRTRPRHAHNLSVPLVPLVRSTSDDEAEKLFGDDEHGVTDADGHPLVGKRRSRPQSLGLGGIMPNYDRDASYATLTAATAAEAVVAAAAAANVNVKSKRFSGRSRPRGSLPAYFSLLKINTAPQNDLDASVSPTSRMMGFGAANWNSRASSPGSAGTETGHSTSRARSRPHARAMHMRATPVVPDVSTLHGVGSLSKSSYTASGSIGMSLRGRKTTLTQRSLTSPERESEASVCAVAKPFTMVPLALIENTQGTPRGRTRSRSQRPSHLRSRSRSHSRSRLNIQHKSDSRDRDRSLEYARRAEHVNALDVIAHANAIATRGRRGRGARRGSRSGSRDRAKRLVSTEPELRGARFGGYGFGNGNANGCGFPTGNGVGYGYAADFWDGAAVEERGRERGRTESRGRRRSRERDRSWIRQRDGDRADMLLQQHLRQLDHQNQYGEVQMEFHPHNVHAEPVIHEGVEPTDWQFGNRERDREAELQADPALVAAAEFQRGRRRAVGVPIRV